MNKTKDQVEAILGKPNRINEHNGMSTWEYEHHYLKGNRSWQTYNPDASEPNKEEDVEFSKGRVYHVAP
jgi:outer membrane protein assembly factor BamE (lipoprotein component of BamABCDE complex)